MWSPGAGASPDGGARRHAGKGERAHESHEFGRRRGSGRRANNEEQVRPRVGTFALVAAASIRSLRSSRCVSPSRAGRPARFGRRLPRGRRRPRPARSPPRRGAHAGGGGAAASSARRALSDLSPSAASNLAPTPRERLFAALPGLGLACGVAQAGFYLADEITARSGVPVAGVPVAILLGACANNAPVPLPSAFRPGIALASSLVLRVGIVCVGAKLSAMDVVTDGASSLPAALASVGAGVLVIPRLARLAGLDPRLGALLAAGTSVCGVTAVTRWPPPSPRRRRR